MLGDLLFVVGFIVLPIVIAAWCVVAVRQHVRRPRSTAEVAVDGAGAALEGPPRDWAASVQPLRARSVEVTAALASPVIDPRHRFYPPRYGGRSRGVVRRMTPRAAQQPLARRGPGGRG